jgi:hypothetical protein
VLQEVGYQVEVVDGKVTVKKKDWLVYVYCSFFYV